MNLLKKLSVGLLAAALPSIATAAPTVVHITGSTAYRASATVAIINQLGGTNCRAAFFGSSPIGKAIFQVFANGTIGSGGTATTVVVTQWTGSVAGPVDLVAQNTSENFINLNDTAVQNAVNGSGALCTAATGGGFSGGSSFSSAPAVTGSAPDAAFSDAFQGSIAASVATSGAISPAIVINGTSVTTGAALAAKIRAAALVEAGTSATPGAGTAAGTVGIVPFMWVLGNYAGHTSANVPFTNITQQSAKAILEGGFVPVAFFNAAWATGTTDFVYLTGRSEDSGTRIINMAEPQDGFGSAILQFAATFSGPGIKTTGALPQPTTGFQVGGAGTTVTSLDFWPANAPLNTESGINWNSDGHGGYVSGGDVANVLSATLPGAINTTGPVTDGSSVYIPNAPFENTGKAYLISYIGIADAGGPSAGGVTGGTPLTYNGVAYSAAAVTAGAYTDWGLEHLWYIKTGFGAIGSAQKTFLDALADSVSGTFAPTNSNGQVNQTDGSSAGIIYSPTSGVNRALEGDIVNINY